MNKNKTELFETIYLQHHPMVLQMCLGFVKGDHAAASDLSQEIFISVWNHLNKFREAASYKTWIYRITVNTCLLHVKKEKRQDKMRSNVTENMATQTVDEKPIDQTKILYNAIGQLEEIDRLIIMMVLEKQNHQSIAKVMGISATNVRVKIHRIKKRLAIILKNNINE